LLGSVIGGPAGGAIGALVAAQFGADPKDADDLVRRIEGDPEAGAKLMQMQLAYWTDLVKLGNEDRANARLSNNQNTKIVDQVIKVGLVLSIISIIHLCLYALINQDIGQTEANIIYMVMGSAFTALTSMIYFYWGSSEGSANKDKMLLDKK
jgi:hypothetical protein